MSIHSVECNVGTNPITIETGKMARLADGAVVVYMLALDAYLTVKIFLLNIDRSHFCRQIFCLDCNCRKKIGKRPFVWCANTTFHQCGVKSEQSAVAFCAYYGKTARINTSFV